MGSAFSKTPLKKRSFNDNRDTQYARRDNYAKQTQFSRVSNEHNLLFDKALRQFSSPQMLQKQSQNKPNSKPIKSQLKPNKANFKR